MAFSNEAELRAMEIARLLSSLEPGILPEPVFHQVARLSVLSIVELVPLRSAAGGQTEVLLTQRPLTDHFWPGMLHSPGTALRSTDDSYDDAISRILVDELGHPQLASPPTFVGNLLHRVRRGTESAAIYYVEVVRTPPIGQFFEHRKLPESLIETQYDTISLAVSAFDASQ